MFRDFFAGVRMIFVCCFMATYLIIVGIPVLTYCRIISNPQLGLYLTKVLDRIILFLGRVHLEVTGLEKLDPKRGCVYVGNHRSHVDSASIFLACPAYARFLIKKEVFRIPLVSFALRTMGMIEVDRSNPDAASRSIDRAVAQIQNGASIILFPEGTRSRQPTILPFKKGAFVLAIKSQAPIVPFTVIGADQALKPDTILLYGGPVKLIFHDPIETLGMNLEDRQELLERTQKTVEAAFRL
jgi:1-acyl-sn-glycerol-3-phosphate acyltransferase